MESFKENLKNLPINSKIVLVGAFLMTVSVFFPWYQDIDKFKSGNLFLGITGPTYLIGILVLCFGGLSLGLIGLHLFNKPTPKLPVKEGYFHIGLAAATGLMLVLAMSIYFHNKFGVNLLQKQAGIGVMISFIGGGLTAFGGYMMAHSKNLVSHGEKIISEEKREAIADPMQDLDMDEPVIDLSEHILRDRTVGELQDRAEQNVYDHGRMAVKNMGTHPSDEGEEQ